MALSTNQTGQTEMITLAHKYNLYVRVAKTCGLYVKSFELWCDNCGFACPPSLRVSGVS